MFFDRSKLRITKGMSSGGFALRKFHLHVDCVAFLVEEDYVALTWMKRLASHTTAWCAGLGRCDARTSQCADGSGSQTWWRAVCPELCSYASYF